jgi:hypothetical protein
MTSPDAITALLNATYPNGPSPSPQSTLQLQGNPLTQLTGGSYSNSDPNFDASGNPILPGSSQSSSNLLNDLNDSSLVNALPIGQPLAGTSAPLVPTNPNNALGNLFNNLNEIFSGGPSGSSTSPATTSPTSSSSGTSIMNLLNGKAFANFSWGRVAGFVLGLILIAAGLFLFGKAEIAPAVTGAIRRGTTI